jgi:hypothetical protein
MIGATVCCIGRRIRDRVVGLLAVATGERDHEHDADRRDDAGAHRDHDDAATAPGLEERRRVAGRVGAGAAQVRDLSAVAKKPPRR